MDQNVAKTNLIPDEIRVEKVSKRRQTAKFPLGSRRQPRKGRGENFDKKMDQNIVETNIVPNEILAKKLSK